MQRRHAQQNYLDCQGWAESPSRRLPGFMVITTNFSNHCTKSSQLCWMPWLSTYITRIVTATEWQSNFRRGARNPCREKLQNHEQHLDVNWPVMFDEQALVRSQAREQGRRLHDEKNKIDGKLAQVDLSSCTEKLFLSHDHNQQTPSCTSVRCMREYSRWKHPL